MQNDSPNNSVWLPAGGDKGYQSQLPRNVLFEQKHTRHQPTFGKLFLECQVDVSLFVKVKCAWRCCTLVSSGFLTNMQWMGGLQRWRVKMILLPLVLRTRSNLLRDKDEFVFLLCPPSPPPLPPPLDKDYFLSPSSSAASQGARTAWSADPCMQVNRWKVPCNIYHFKFAFKYF